MKTSAKKIFSLVILFMILLFIISGCEYVNNGETTDKPETTAVSISSAYKSEKTAAEILAIYTLVMNQAKSEKPGFESYSFQELPKSGSERAFRLGKGNYSKVLGIINELGIIKTEEQAALQAQTKIKGEKMVEFPLFGNNHGCLLQADNIGFLKSISYVSGEDGKAVITLVTNEENNPMPVPEETNIALSKTGAVFNPFAQSEIDAFLSQKAITRVTNSISYDLTYHDCTSVLVFNPDTMQIFSLEQIMRIRINAYIDLKLVEDIDVTQELYISEKWFNFNY